MSAAIRFYLVRHGIAETKLAKDDAARRLTPEGRSRFAAQARSLASGPPLARIVTSPFERARETAELLSVATHAEVTEEDALASGSSSGRALLALGERLGGGTALVGHNPEIGEAVALAAGRVVEVPPGTIAAIDADEGRVRLAWLRVPA